MKKTRSFLDFVVRRGGYKIPKKVSGLPLHENVEILEDRYGIPHIFAANEHDLAVAFGFVQANDRLWQMELIRRLATGRLSEILGIDSGAIAAVGIRTTIEQPR